MKFARYSLNTKQTDRQTFDYKFLLFWICISLFLASCGNNTEKSEATLLLNDENINEFTANFAYEYIDTLDRLLVAFRIYKKADDSHGFIDFTNKAWDREYKIRNRYYQTVLEKNHSYISQKPIKPLFDKFEELLDIGLNLKYSLLNDDKAQSQTTLTTIKKDKRVVNTAIVLAGMKARQHAAAYP